MKKKKYNKVNKKLKYCYPEKAVYLITCSAQTLPSKCLEDTYYYFVIQQLLELPCLFLINTVTRSCSTKTLKTLPKCTVSILTYTVTRSCSTKTLKTLPKCTVSILTCSHPELFHKNSENSPKMHCFHSNLQITYILRKWLRCNYVIFTQNCWLGCVFQLWILQNFSEYFFLFNTCERLLMF